MLAFGAMIERAHQEAYRIAAEAAWKAIKEGKDAEADVAEQQMTAIRELEKARKEIFDRFGVPDIQSVRTRRLVSTISVLRSPLEELTYTLLLRRLRIEAKLSQHQVANKLGVNQSTISKVESGGATSISAERFLEALGLDTDDPKAQLLITKSPQ